VNDAIKTTYMPAMRVRGGGTRTEESGVVGEMDQVIFLIDNNRFIIADIAQGGTIRLGMSEIERLAEVAALPVREEFQRRVLQCARTLQEFWDHQHKDDRLPLRPLRFVDEIGIDTDPTRVPKLVSASVDGHDISHLIESIEIDASKDGV
jgi:hypothetical protein